MKLLIRYYLLIFFSFLVVYCEVENGERNPKNDEVLWDILNECINGVDSVSTCLKIKVLNYYDYNMDEISTSPRNLKSKDVKRLDRLLVKRFKRYINTHEFHLELPKFLFQGANVVYRPGRSLDDFDVEFPRSKEENNETNEVTTARDMMKDKMLLPLLLMLKMKMKMITPIMLTLVSIKATKALVISKLALLLVVGFLASQFLKKIGMAIPLLSHPLDSLSLPMSMAMPMTTQATAFAPSYGPPQPPASSYGEPPNSWEPSSNGNSYQRMWDAHQMAYNSYLPSNSNINSKNNDNSNSPPIKV